MPAATVLTSAERAKATEPHGYVLKPFRDRELQIAIEMALYKHSAEMIIWESREWLAATLRSVGEAVIANDRNGAVSFMNAAAEKLTGWREEDAKGRPLSDVLRLLDGKPLYPPPSVDFIPFLYTPLYPALLALGAKVAGLGYTLGRAVSIASYVGAFALDKGGAPAFFAAWALAMAVVFAALALVRRHIPRPAHAM